MEEEVLLAIEARRKSKEEDNLQLKDEEEACIDEEASMEDEDE